MRQPKYAVGDFSFLGNAIAETGLRTDVLEVIFLKYCGPRTPIPNRKALADVMHYLRHYPPHRYNATRLRQGRSSGTQISVRFGRIIDYLADHVDELLEVQRSRFQPANVLPEDQFGPYVTGQLDVFPVIIRRPQGAEDQQRLYYASTF